MLALDTDVLVHWAMEGAAHHRATRRLVEREIRGPEGRLALTPQLLFEFVHVVTDPRRFESPLTVPGATALVRDLWDSREVIRVLPGPSVVHRTLELLTKLRLGRKRILDTALAATLEAAGISRLATLNGPDFEIFPFIEVVSPV